ncbi:Uncharacterized phosphatase YwpJ [uncultured Clostridium sp.]|nr:Uncharacterized phosphatase YwpJ [uncultured Clostridium sp.]
MIKHIFCDLDGTLYHHGISDDDIKAIEAIEKKGVVFNIATGRAFKQASKMIKGKLDLNGYYICQNGAFVYDKNHNEILKEVIDDNLVKKVVNRFKSDDAYIFFMHDGNIVISGGEDILDEFDRECINDPDFFKKDSFDNLVGNIGILSRNEDELGRMDTYYKNEFEGILDVYLSGKYVLNISPSHISKGNAIKHVCSILNVNLDEIATIGDSPNDISMLKGFKYSFSMDSSREDVKKSSAYTVKSVKEAIEVIEKTNGVEN